MLRNNIEEGISVMTKILDDPLIDDIALQELKISCLLSAAEAYEETENYSEALKYFFRLSQIRDKDFCLWFKMGKLARKLGYLDESEYLFN